MWPASEAGGVGAVGPRLPRRSSRPGAAVLFPRRQQRLDRLDRRGFLTTAPGMRQSHAALPPLQRFFPPELGVMFVVCRFLRLALVPVVLIFSLEPLVGQPGNEQAEVSL